MQHTPHSQTPHPPHLHTLPLVAALALATCCFASAQPPITPGELVPPGFRFVGGNVEFNIEQSVAGRRYQLQQSDTLEPGSWIDVETERLGAGGPLVITLPRAPGVPRRFYRLALDPGPPVPAGFALVPAGEFLMGDQSSPLVGGGEELPVRTVYVSAFFMARYEVSKELWNEVHAWGKNNGYTDLLAGGGKAADHPVQMINWFAAVKWCNARSQKEGLTPCYSVSGATYKTGQQSTVVCNWNANGYRLPTEAEWEKAARGGAVGKNFPWGTDTISHSQANYNVYSSDGTTNDYSYDVTPRPPGSVNTYYHPTYKTGGSPFTAPVGSFDPNGYGLYDMAGNVWEWCWDWYSADYYASSPGTDPRGASSSSLRVDRGGGWSNRAYSCRVAVRGTGVPGNSFNHVGFRVARSSVP